ncbi:DUF488 domain-containing protein [Chelatococcus reniformis]|uniref:DUF488 domain-containing protein n=1 Tax=Chelatococcus reniformis TaxID=1494448 RepID=A0A916TY19_9HYPH|nr:DUF488 family protein [Chelatococcus reniformis]GGC49673.1 hypothetical protein GCM10010994_06080 [Chelatococcus reniformis]
MIRVKRVYAQAVPEDGARILVDRLWPRGFTKASAPWERWMKEIAPSNTLRRRVHALSEAGHQEQAWAEFVAAYSEELDDLPAAVEELRTIAAEGPVTLLYAARDEAHNNAVALAAYMKRKGGASG